MALIDCYECEKQVSDQAVNCPNCGAPLKKPGPAPDPAPQHVSNTRTGAAWEGSGFLLIVGGLFMAMAASPGGGGLGVTLMFVGFVIFLIGRFK